MSCDESSLPDFCLSSDCVKKTQLWKLTSLSFIVFVCCLRQVRHAERADESVLTNAALMAVVNGGGNGKRSSVEMVVLMLLVFSVFLFLPSYPQGS